MERDALNARQKVTADSRVQSLKNQAGSESRLPKKSHSCILAKPVKNQLLRNQDSAQRKSSGRQRNKMGVQLPAPDSKFVKVRCKKCKNEQVIFGKAASEVKCLVCGTLLAAPTGGKTKFRGRVLEVLE